MLVPMREPTLRVGVTLLAVGDRIPAPVAKALTVMGLEQQDTCA